MIEDAKVNSQKLLILGCGDLGRRLAGQLAPQGYAVTGLRRHPPEDTPQLTYIATDASRIPPLERALVPDYDVVVITLTPDERTDEGYYRSYVRSCENLVMAMKNQAQTPRLVVFVSSTGVYGQSDGEWVDETSPTEPDRFSGKRLLEAERVISGSGFPYCIVRFSGIYGPGRDRMQTLVRQGRATLSGRYTNRIHSDDCAGVLAHLIEQNREGQPIEPLYIASDDEPAPMAEVVNWLAMQMKVDQARFAPDEGGLGKRCDNARLKASGYVFQYPSYREGYEALLNARE